MQDRINIAKVSPEGYNTLLGVEKFIAGSPLSSTHKELIKIRASQINGCAFCINMHTTDALKNGETPKRIFLLNAWREADAYTDEEKAILALTEEITNIQDHVSEETYANAAQYFDEKYLAAVIMIAISINSWNRLAIATGARGVIDFESHFEKAIVYSGFFLFKTILKAGFMLKFEIKNIAF